MSAASTPRRASWIRDAIVETLAPKHGGVTRSWSLPADLVDVICSFVMQEDTKDSLLAQEAERSLRPWQSRPW